MTIKQSELVFQPASHNILADIHNDGLTLPFEATYGFLLTIGLMVGIIILANALHKRKIQEELLK